MPTEEVLSTGLVTDLNAFVSSCTFPQGSFVLLEEVPSRVLTSRKDREKLVRFVQLSDQVDLSKATSGRIFQTGFELRWQRETPWIPTRPSIRVVYVGDAATLPAQLAPGQPLRTWRAGLQALKPRPYYLFGTLLNEEQVKTMGLPTDQHMYAEVRVPRLLCYPLQAQQVQLVVQEYSDKSTGRVQLLRFAGLKAAEGRPA